jgi:hypothetical protein
MLSRRVVAEAFAYTVLRLAYFDTKESKSRAVVWNFITGSSTQMKEDIHTYQLEISPVPVVLSCAISFLGAYAAMVTFEQYRLCSYMSISPKLFGPNAELAIIAILLGGVAIWTMHFVGMSSCVLKYRDVDIVSPIYYRIGLTFASLVAVIVLCFIGKDPTNVVAAMSFS